MGKKKGGKMIILLIVVLFIFFLIIAIKGIKIVAPYQKGVVERLGRYHRTADPGLTMILPFFDKIRKVDMRERVVDVPPQEVITKDNVVVTVDAVIYYEVTDPVKVLYNVANFYVAVTKLAQTNLRNLIGDMSLDESLTSRERINTKLRQILDEATDKWGVKVTKVELQKIEPPPDVTEAMHRQMKAERDRRAMILEAEGKKQSEIEKAEGEKRAKILRAEGEAESIKRVAEANKFKLLTVAEGEAEAIKRVFNAIHEGRPSKDLITIKYLEALVKMADGKSSKVFIPYEASGVLSALGMIKELLQHKEEGKEEK